LPQKKILSLKEVAPINNITFHFSLKNGIELEKDQIQLCLANSISWVVLAGIFKANFPIIYCFISE
jgi:hypothetical protein